MPNQQMDPTIGSNYYRTVGDPLCADSSTIREFAKPTGLVSQD